MNRGPRSNTRHSPGIGILAQGVRVNGFGDAGASGGLAKDVPDCLGGDGLIAAFALDAGKQPVGLALQRTIVSAQLIEQLGAEGAIAVPAAILFIGYLCYLRTKSPTI